MLGGVSTYLSVPHQRDAGRGLAVRVQGPISRQGAINRMIAFSRRTFRRHFRRCLIVHGTLGDLSPGFWHLPGAMPRVHL